MNTLYNLIGAVVFWFAVFSVFGWVDFNLCIGPVGSCDTHQSVKEGGA